MSIVLVKSSKTGNNLRDRIARTEASAVTGRAFARLGVHLQWVSVRDMKKTPANAQLLVSDLEVRQVTRSECLSACSTPELGLEIEFVNHAFDNGGMCHAALSDDGIVSYCWRTTRAGRVLHRPGVEVEVSDQFSYGYKALTLPEYRGRGIYPAIAEAERKNCVKYGILNGISFAAFSNLASLRSNQKFGNEILGVAGYRVTIGHTQVFREPKVSRAGFSFVSTFRT